MNLKKGKNKVCGKEKSRKSERNGKREERMDTAKTSDTEMANWKRRRDRESG